jgi:SAGA-associated factor 29
MYTRFFSDIEKVRRIQNEQKRRSNLRRGELIQLLQQQARTLPLWIGRVDGHPPPLVGGIPLDDDEKLNIGDYVAALVDDIWIMAEVKVCTFQNSVFEHKI